MLRKALRNILLFVLALVAFEAPIFFQQVRFHQFDCLQRVHASDWAQVTCLVAPSSTLVHDRVPYAPPPASLAMPTSSSPSAASLTQWIAPWTTHAFDIYLHAYSFVAWAPLMVVYRAIYWNDAPHAEICASLTGVETAHWQAFPDQCHRRIFKHLDRFLIGAHLCILLPLFAYWLYHTLFYKSPNDHVREMLQLMLSQQRIVYTPRDQSPAQHSHRRLQKAE
jgi:hypothetical protein